MIRIQILNKAERDNLQNIEDLRTAESEKLKNLINTEKAGWFDRAKTRTENFRQAKTYNELSGIWSEIKDVYKKLQSSKCAYCEQKLEDKNIVHDVEHYRPKKNVRIWLNDDRKQKLGFAFNDTKDNGYYLLPYNILNYVTTCKHCNSALKSDYFPIAGTRKTDSENFTDINNAEKPFLIYPLGHLEEIEPEKIITFDGVLPVPHSDLTDNFLIQRAKVTIEFFNLDILRDTLIEERCEVIKVVFNAVKAISETSDQDEINEKIDEIKIACSPKSRHSNCAKSFYNLCKNNIEKAKKIAKEAHIYLVAHRVDDESE
jgi:hypothetical protein